ncbi:uncharacterized protein LOC131601427 [Vicia villosa]|uniref:uncharacterized protein LOC131601427 n=1 Tax=Vicia villosa TaxID=3911 RepID=UPI00273C2456|nr:uncharacterized protein LOC131601427 [Vicia villosa]
MGLEMLEEFRSITSIKRNTVPTSTITTTATTLNQHSLEDEQVSDLERRIEDCNYQTPPSSPSRISFNLVCPPPPRKRRRLAVASSQSRERKFFQDVPDDLASIFLLRAKPATASHQFKQLAS